jgi:hypothetical protein
MIGRFFRYTANGLFLLEMVYIALVALPVHRPTGPVVMAAAR